MSLHPIGREGELRLTFARQAGNTVLTENYSRPPLQVMRAISDNAQCLCIYLLSPTGGVVQGDRYHIQIRVGADTHALFTTQSATKVYKMPDDYAEQFIRIDVESGAIFEFVPDAAILFADSDLRQHIEVTLQPGALLLLHEVIMPGRFARGEHLQFLRYVNRIVVRDVQGLLLHDAATIEPLRTNLDTIGVLEGYRCWGSAYLLGDLKGRGIDAAAFCETHAALFERPDALGSISPLYRNGIGVRMLSQRLETIYAAFHELRGLVRTQYLGLAEAALRK